MTTSRKTPSMFKPEGDKKIPNNTLSYFKARNKNAVHGKILAALKSSGVTQAQIARRLGKRPDVVCRLIGAPGNWTLDTAIELIFAINGHEIDYSFSDPFGGQIRNQSEPDWLAPFGKLQSVNSKATNPISLVPISLEKTA